MLWSDTKVLLENELPLQTGSDFIGLFDMLARERFDYFPRSVLEVDDELIKFKKYNLSIDPHILIHYPTAYYFYVKRNNKQLAEDIEYGLTLAIKDGSFDVLFDQYFSKAVDYISSGTRHVIYLNNPFLPENTPVTKSKFWIKK